MGLYMNDGQHPGVYRSRKKLNESNQIIDRRDYLSEVLASQQKTNRSFHRAVYGLRHSQKKLETRQSNQWKELMEHLEEMQEMSDRHEELEQAVLTWLKSLELKNRKLQLVLKHEQDSKKDLVRKVEGMNQLNQDLMTRLNELSELNGRIETKVDEQTEIQKSLSGQVTRLETAQQEVVDKIDSQEGLIDKLNRQIDHIRSVLFERTNHLEGKIEHLYKTTAALFQKLTPKNKESVENTDEQENVTSRNVH
jgi:chromosome segregation ATPase